MDHFEKELSRMMRETEQHAPFQRQQQKRLRAGVRTRRRTRGAWIAAGSALTVAGMAIGAATISNAFAHDPAAPAHTAQSAQAIHHPSFLQALQHDIPAELGRLHNDTKPNSFVLIGPKGTKTNLAVYIYRTSSASAGTADSCAPARKKAALTGAPISCTQLPVPGGSGWSMSGTEQGLKFNSISYQRPYGGEWLMVTVESCNALHACETGSDATHPPQTPTTSAPPLSLAQLKRIATDEAVISASGAPLKDLIPPTPPTNSAPRH
ncbi:MULTISPECIES: hypothetical protein [unclassified Streptomyces]|uniref:hypothetical protein n=1 Tax=unclassified Streptomyces TaxID=2593676 RepID=UPI003D9411D1